MLALAPAKASPELELKFQLGSGAVEALQGDVFPLEQAKISQMHAVYFDTPGHALRDGAFSLRVRRRGEIYVQTLKHRSGGGIFQRDEWETQIAGPDLDFDVLKETPAADAVGDAVLAPCFSVEVERRAYHWVRGDAHIEVSFDTGLIVAGERQERVAEMELELLAGPAQALFDLARELHATATLTLSFESKAERGYRLAGHDGVAALKAQHAAVGPTTCGDAAFQLIARDALVQVAVNAQLLQQHQNADILHQLRVGLRRLRAALSVFTPMLDAEGLNAARTETRWLAGEVAEARDLDVFVQRASSVDEIEESAGRAAFFRALRNAQAEAYGRALAAVRSERFRTLLLRLGEWIEVGGWRKLANDRQRLLREQAVTHLAAPVLTKLDHRVRRRSRKFRDFDAAARHDLRKQVKKLRYAAAFFGEAFPEHPKRRARFTAALRELQDQLGELQDMAVARSVAMRAVGRKSGDMAFAAGLEVGHLTSGEEKVADAANDALKAYRKVKPFWSAPKSGDEDLNLSTPRLLSV